LEDLDGAIVGVVLNEEAVLIMEIMMNALVAEEEEMMIRKHRRETQT
jgi:hypothetical protein